MKIKMICSTCGSANVRRDAWAEWDEARQDWVLGEVFDAAHCDDCEGETRIAELPMSETETTAATFTKHDPDLCLVKAVDLQEGDLVDLEGDPYGDPDGCNSGPDGEHAWIAFEYAQVLETERETDACLRVDFDAISVGFPPNHELRTRRAALRAEDPEGRAQAEINNGVC